MCSVKQQGYVHPWKQHYEVTFYNWVCKLILSILQGIILHWIKHRNHILVLVVSMILGLTGKSLFFNHSLLYEYFSIRLLFFVKSPLSSSISGKTGPALGFHMCSDYRHAIDSRKIWVSWKCSLEPLDT